MYSIRTLFRTNLKGGLQICAEADSAQLIWELIDNDHIWIYQFQTILY